MRPSLRSHCAAGCSFSPPCGEKVGLRGRRRCLTAGNYLQRLSFVRTAQNRGEAPSPVAHLRCAPTSPRTQGEVTRRRTSDRSRDVFFCARVLLTTNSEGQAANEKRCSPRAFTFRPDLRQLSPAVGPAFASGIGTVTNERKRKRRKRNAKRTLFLNLRSLHCGTHPRGRARLPAFHRGSCPRDSRIPRAQLRTRLRGGRRR